MFTKLHFITWNGVWAALLAVPSNYIVVWQLCNLSCILACGCVENENSFIKNRYAALFLKIPGKKNHWPINKQTTAAIIIIVYICNVWLLALFQFDSVVHSGFCNAIMEIMLNACWTCANIHNGHFIGNSIWPSKRMDNEQNYFKWIKMQRS